MNLLLVKNYLAFYVHTRPHGKFLLMNNFNFDAYLNSIEEPIKKFMKEMMKTQLFGQLIEKSFDLSHESNEIKYFIEEVKRLQSMGKTTVVNDLFNTYEKIRNRYDNVISKTNYSPRFTTWINASIVMKKY